MLRPPDRKVGLTLTVGEDQALGLPQVLIEEPPTGATYVCRIDCASATSHKRPPRGMHGPGPLAALAPRVAEGPVTPCGISHPSPRVAMNKRYITGGNRTTTSPPLLVQLLRGKPRP